MLFRSARQGIWCAAYPLPFGNSNLKNPSPMDTPIFACCSSNTHTYDSGNFADLEGKTHSRSRISADTVQRTAGNWGKNCVCASADGSGLHDQRDGSMAGKLLFYCVDVSAQTTARDRLSHFICRTGVWRLEETWNCGLSIL